MYEGLPKASNTVYYDKSRPPTYINNNGTLSVVDTQGQIVTAQSHSYDCKAVQGSFQKTCNISAVPYTPSDPNLINQFFCVMTSKCRDLVGSLVNAKNVFYKSTLADKTTKFENCNGELVVHTDPKRDGMCDGKSSEQMQAALAQIAGVGNQHSGYTL